MGKVHNIYDIKIAAQTIGEAGFERDVTLAPEDAACALGDPDLEVRKPFQIHYELSRHEESIAARVRVQGEFSTFCSRCLEELTYPVDLSLQTVYMAAPPDMPPDLEAERVSPELGYYRNEIPLGEYIQSELVLSLPMRYVCAPDCKGLCPQCGANLNQGQCSCTRPVDPRLEKLAELKKKIRR